MCGIAGILNLDERPVDYSLFESMLDTLRHRGPDDEGYLFINTRTNTYQIIGGEDTPASVFTSQFPYTPKHKLCGAPDAFSGQSYNLALGNRRLAIIDLSPAGHQPMCNEDGTLWITHNGEIYNFRELRQELKPLGHRFVSDTDTEVIVHAYEEWGPDCLNRFNGMWAFCIWDSRRKKLFCSRDRFGIKPFYYYFDGESFLFASEIKALLQASVPRRANERRIYDYLALGLEDHMEETFFEGIKQIRGGQYLELQIDKGNLNIQRYWNIDPGKKLLGLSEADYARRFYELLEDSVCLRLISDVPVGTCLSGGLDSSTIVCLVDKLMREKEVKIPGSDIQKTFSARYEDPRHDEGRFIEEVVQKTHVDTRSIYITGNGLMKEIEQLIYHQDEPFGSTSIYAQWNVFKLAKDSGVKVTLDGQGADELLAGYDGFYTVYLANLLKSFHLLLFLREIKNITNNRPGFSPKGALYSTMVFILPSYLRSSLAWIKHKMMPSLDWLDPQFVSSYRQGFLEKYPRDFDKAFVQTLMQTSLPALLRYEDHNSMAHSIESRVPFLDYRLVEFLLSLPPQQKIHHGINKVVLRNAMKGLIPEIVRQRMDKIGFSTPEDVWFRSAMKGFIQKLMASEGFRSRPYFEAEQVKNLFEIHLQGKQDLSTIIWRIVNLELWLRRFID